MAQLLNKIRSHLSEWMTIRLIYRHDKEFVHWYFQQRKKLDKFKNINAGEDCFIIGNGPSLKKMDLLPLNNYHTFGLNKIHLLLDKISLDLSYHVAVNPLVIRQSATEFERLHCPSFISYRYGKDIIRPLNHIYFIMNHGEPYTFQTDLLRGLHEGYTVTFVAMQIAFYMGFKNVFLIGVDHNFVAKGKENEKQIMIGEDPNHFDPTYFSNNEWNLPDLEASELSYHMAKFFYSRDNRSIFDATVGGNLKIFPKIDYSDALQIAKRKSHKQFITG